MRSPTMRATITALALLATGCLTAAAPPALAVPDQSIVAETSPMGQVNARVWTMVHGNGVLYVGGEFTSSRPSGSAAGTNEVPRSRLAAFNSQTGALTSLNVGFDDIVRGLDLSPDGKTLYVVGKFRNANENGGTWQARGRGAAIDLATGKLTTWNPKLGDTAWSLDATASAVYVGGSFGAANSQPRSRLAALATTGTTVLPWAPKADGYVRTLKVAPSGTRIVVGGGFNNLNDQPMRAFGVLDLDGKNVAQFANNQILPDYRPDPTTGGCCYTEGVGLTSDADGMMYIAAEGTGGGRFDGSVKFNPETGAVLWRDNCLGATQMVLPLNGAVYKASHAHDCSANEGGFPEVRTTASANPYHLLALDQATGAILHWYPAINGGSGLGPRVFATDGNQLFVGGEFTQAGNKPQQAVARFGTGLPSSLPRKPLTPVAAVCPEGVQVRFPATWDPDDATLTYDVFRNSVVGTPIATLTQESRPYSLPKLKAVDPAPPAAGQSVRYVVRASDGRGGVSTSAPSTAVVGGSVANTYPTAVTCDGAEYYWRLADSGTTAADSTLDGTDTGTYTGGATSGAAGVLQGNAAASFNGVDGVVVGNKAEVGLQDFTVEAWVKTTSQTGGKVIGFGNNNSGQSSNYDRHIYLTSAGKAVFGVWDGGPKTITSAARLNDGSWHHVVGTKNKNVVSLFVDGSLVGSRSDSGPAQGYTGYWRVGGDNIGGWPSQPSSSFLNGQIDEVAVYGAVLDANAVQNHYTLSGNVVAPPPPVPTSCPTDQYFAQYFNTMTLEGQAVLTQCETAIDNDWGGGSPAAEVNVDQFSARWTSDRTFAAGNYVFETVSDDGIRVFVDDVPVIDNWTDHGPTTDTAVVLLTEGIHRVVVEYYENGGGAMARLAINPSP